MITVSEVYDAGSKYFEGGNFFVEIHRIGIRFVHETIVDGQTQTESHFLQRNLEEISVPELLGFLQGSTEEPNYSES
ncbi:hypothetical protein Q5384_14450 [Enterobacter ludwigii]|uniref:hypothetical protein n=1 Tax=Enterobacter ludwigii TaxID=299767 RepID=UPI002B4BF2D3|nr:hypothetical protein [Enterobacter ludwigii]WRM03033.1 hypothetical protein Q5384_14450 [Enterobacter ludwigii]